MSYETAKIITDEGLEGLGRYYSVYRGIVVDNNDVEKNMNRIKVCVPEVMGGVFAWAYPKGQHGSLSSGFKYLAPKVGDMVFITFEFGDPTKPLWEYHGWGMNQIPQPLNGPNKIGIITAGLRPPFFLATTCSSVFETFISILKLNYNC